MAVERAAAKEAMEGKEGKEVMEDKEGRLKISAETQEEIHQENRVRDQTQNQEQRK